MFGLVSRRAHLAFSFYGSTFSREFHLHYKDYGEAKKNGCLSGARGCCEYFHTNAGNGSISRILSLTRSVSHLVCESGHFVDRVPTVRPQHWQCPNLIRCFPALKPQNRSLCRTCDPSPSDGCYCTRSEMTTDTEANLNAFRV